MLCIALTLMIAGVQSVSLASSVGHATQPDHAHDAIEALLLVAEAEQSDHHLDGGDVDQGVDGPVGGGHHHHADGVGSIVLAWSNVAYNVTTSKIQLAAAGDATLLGWAPDGIERPPRLITIRI